MAASVRITSRRPSGHFLRSAVPGAAIALYLAASCSPTACAQEAAKSADSFVNTIGVNIHLGWANTPYTNYAATKSALLGLGVRHVRDTVTFIATDPNLISDTLDLGTSGIHMQGGFDGNWYPTPVGSTPLSSSDVVTKVSALMPAIETVEGPNETDLSTIFSYNGHGAFPGGTIAYDQDMYSIIKGSSTTSSLPVLLGSIGNASNFPQMAAITPSPVAYTDYGNIHSYPGGQIADNGIDWCLGYAAQLSGTKPVICGETGYHNNTQSLPSYLQPGVSEAAAGKYMPAVFLEMYNRGIVRCLAYELVDQYPDPSFTDGNGEDHFGLMHNDWSPKPAYTAIANEISLLKEPGASFAPGSLTYTISTVPSTVHHSLLEKSNGVFYLALWNDVSCYHTNSGSGGYDLTNANVAATITTSVPKGFTVYSPSDTSGTSVTTSFTSSTTSTSISLNIPDHVILLAIAPPIPSSPTGLTATGANTTVTLGWTATSGATSYNLYRGTTTGGESSSAIATGITTTSYTDASLTNGTAYYYKIAAVNAGGTSTLSAEATATPNAPDLIVTSVSYTPTTPIVGSNMVFTAVVKNQGLAPTPAGILIGVGFGIDGAGASTWSSHDTTSLAPGASVSLAIDGGVAGNFWVATAGSHTVTAWVDDVNRIAESNETNNKLVQAFTVVSVPTAPTGLTATIGNAEMSLAWTAVSGAASYNIYRATTAGGEGTTAVATGITSASYTDTGLTNNTTYYYKVAAVNAAGTSPQSSEASGTPNGLPDVIVTNVSWTPASPATGNQMVFTATVKNQGLGATPSGIVLGVGFGIDGAGSTTWNVADTTALAPGSSVTLTANGGATTNYWVATSGSHTVTAWVDDVNRITESNETNNKLVGSFTVSP